MKLKKIIFLIVSLLFVLITISGVLSMSGEFFIVGGSSNDSEGNFFITDVVFGDYDLAYVFCGDNIKNGAESCDGVDYGTLSGTCNNYNAIYGSGNLNCSASCVIDTSSCVIATSSPTTGGGGSSPTTGIGVSEGFQITTEEGKENKIYNGLDIRKNLTANFYIINTNSSRSIGYRFSCEGNYNICDSVEIEMPYVLIQSGGRYLNSFKVNMNNLDFNKNYVLNIIASDGQNINGITYFLNTKTTNKLTATYFRFIPFILVCIFIAFIMGYLLVRYFGFKEQFKSNIAFLIGFAVGFILSFLYLPIL